MDATLRIEGWLDSPSLTLATEIRGRGNSTWNALKKPYRLRVARADVTEVLGMPADRDWALLANHYDKSMLRNAVALCLGSQLLRSTWTPRFQYAELTLNGSADGLYQVTEHLKVADHRLNLGDDSVDANDLAATFSIEMDKPITDPTTPEADKDPYFVTATYGQPYVFHADLVDEDDANYAAQQAAIKQHVDVMEAALNGPDFADPERGYAAYIDVDSMVDMYLLQELTRNNDAYHWSSSYLHRARGGKIVFGPPWDFDLALGNHTYMDNHLAEGWWTARSVYFHRAFQDPAFRAKVQARWTELKAMQPQLMLYVDQMAANLQAASANNARRWPLENNNTWGRPEGIANTTEAHVQHMRDWLTQRFTWLDAQFNGPNGGPPSDLTAIP